jgi:2-polyprenyl-3-methyl-5-hydroxy-6-metoxy-1,4-benzoquinol methylase
MILIASTSLQPVPAGPAPESAVDQHMHQTDFDTLVARFEESSRAEWQKPDQVIASLGSLDGKTVADIGTGSGYFAFPIAKKAAKVIAIDIDQRFLDYIEHKKQTQKIGANIEARLTVPDSAGLKPLEADVVLIVNTFHHIENRVEYLRKLRDGLRKGGMLVIVDFKKEKTEVGPPLEFRFSEDQVQSELKAAGYTVVSTDKETLPYQYLIKAQEFDVLK